MHPAISKHLAMLKCATLSKQQLSHLALAHFFLLDEYPSVKQTSEKVLIETKLMITDCGNLTPIQHLLEVSFNLFYTRQKVKFTIDIDIILLVVFTKLSNMAINILLSQISYTICLINMTNKTNIMYQYNWVIRSVSAVRLYATIHRLDIEKQY